ncbi:MAG: glycosyltransferase [Vicinamibacterales bacterium]
MLLAPHGTRGDIQPMLALGVALRARGHIAVFSVPSGFLEWIRANGFEAISNGTDIQAEMRSPGAQLDSIRWMFGRLKAQTAQMFEPIARASEGADVIVGAGAQLVTASIADWRDVPHATIAFCPCAMPSRAVPPPTIKAQALPGWINRLLWQVGLAAADVALRGTINRGRAALGLRSVDGPLAQIVDSRVIISADPQLAPPGDDAPGTVVSTDAMIFVEPHAPDPRLEAFLNQDPAPIYVGFGSMVASHAADVAAHAIAATRALGRPAIIAGGWAGLDRYVAAAPDLLTVGATPHHAVFPRVAAIVHHGGAGTTTAAASAGVPQVLLPHLLDQFYWAHRVERLGLGPRGLPVSLVTADVLSDRLDIALNDAGIRRKAAALGPTVAARNGADDTVDCLEQLVGTDATTRA